MKDKIFIRNAETQDAKELLDIYSYYVQNTAVTFEWDVPSLEEFTQRIAEVKEKFPYIVAEIEDENSPNKKKIIGYAYAHTFRTRAAFAWTAETSIYVHKDYRRGGIGKELLFQLEKELTEIGIQNAYACIAYIQKEDEYLTHDSVNFHNHMNYIKVGEFTCCGYKFNRWYNLVVMEKMLGSHPENPKPLQKKDSSK
ncbi:MAG: N-acetyltransferase family protein [Treponema sp.]|nr:N-acetyltransferase family protein [Treponema sp.]